MQLHDDNAASTNDWLTRMASQPDSISPFSGIVVRSAASFLGISRLPDFRIGLRHWLVLITAWLAWLLWHWKSAVTGWRWLLSRRGSLNSAAA